MKNDPIRITVCAVSAPAIRQLADFQKEYAGERRSRALSWHIFHAVRPLWSEKEKAELTEAVRTADAAVIDLMGAPEELCDVVAAALKDCGGQRIVIGNNCRDLTRLGRFSMGMMSGMGGKGKKNGGKDSAEDRQAEGGGEAKPKKSAAHVMRLIRRMSLVLGTVVPAGMPADMKNLFRLIDYWQQAEPEDIRSFMYLLLRNYFGEKELPKPKPCTMRYGIYLKDPKTGSVTDSPQRYAATVGFSKEKPTVALFQYGHRYPNDFSPVADMLRAELAKSCNILDVAFTQNEDSDLDTLEKILSDKAYPLRAIVNLLSFRLGAGPMGGDAERAVRILEKAGVPYFKPFCMTRTSLESWREGDPVNPGEFLIDILLPELDGGILTVPAGVVAATEQTSELLPVEERIRSLAARIGAYLSLQGKANGAKKIALICYNNPPGEGNLFGGAFLDTAETLSVLLRVLKEAGYDSAEASADSIRESFLKDGAVNAPVWSDTDKPLAMKRLGDEEYPIYGKTYGSILIALQPLRAEHMDETTVHDKNLPPTMKYQAFYRWLEEDFHADAVVHVGTHGTLEFLPGREAALSGDCWPDRLIGSTPHFYLYYMGNPSEAMIARRRTHAALIGYQPPKFRESGLYGGFAELKALIDEYRESLNSAPEKCAELLERIETAAGDLGLPGGGKAGRAADLDAMEGELLRFEESMIPDGLHVFGQADCGECREIEGLLAALEGRYIPCGKAGDIMKNDDLFPSGRNLVQFDPRAVPTVTAFDRGARAAKLLLERYHDERGVWPKTTAVILWGLETSRSQGETVGQIMEYLGIRLKETFTSFDDRFEIVPAEELEHPRVDVVVQICGFFRDMFPNLTQNFNVMLRKLDELNEPDEVSSFAANTRVFREQLTAAGMERSRAAELARSRIFGPAPGEYATALTDIVRTGKWTEEKTLGDIFTGDLSYVYSEHFQGVSGKELLTKQYEQVEMISQLRSMADYELTDLDHYYEFYGGLARAVENVRGEPSALYVADTAGAEVRAEGLASSLQRGIGTRLLNPAWIDGMMRHGYHGVQQINRRFENVLGFSAATGEVGSETFSRMEACYVGDRRRQEQLRSANRYAYISMLERLMEANHRGYWDATDEELAEVRQAYLKTEGEAEG